MNNTYIVNSLNIFVKLSPVVEIAIAIPCILLNLYLAMRFSKVHTFNPNFRKVLVRIVISAK